jgi:Tol biopolymer transport system component
MLKSLFLPLAFLAINASSQTKTPITHEIMWSMKRVSAPEISPDGKWVVFSVTEPSYDEKESVTDLWVGPADGAAEPRRLTGGKSGESGQKWSPDGKFLAFSAKRDGTMHRRFIC